MRSTFMVFASLVPGTSIHECRMEGHPRWPLLTLPGNARPRLPKAGGPSSSNHQLIINQRRHWTGRRLIRGYIEAILLQLLLAMPARSRRGLLYNSSYLFYI